MRNFFLWDKEDSRGLVRDGDKWHSYSVAKRRKPNFGPTKLEKSGC